LHYSARTFRERDQHWSDGGDAYRACSCGAVTIDVRGAPLEMGYCHCENCRRYSAAPVSAFTLWKKENVSVTKGEEFLGRFKSSDISEHGYCTKCGGDIIVEHPTLGLTDVRIGALRNFPFKPKVNLNYAETVLPMKDGLPKLKDFPASGNAAEVALLPTVSLSQPSL
jgi:hypothetical protein